MGGEPPGLGGILSGPLPLLFLVPLVMIVLWVIFRQKNIPHIIISGILILSGSYNFVFFSAMLNDSGRLGAGGMLILTIILALGVVATLLGILGIVMRLIRKGKRI